MDQKPPPQKPEFKPILPPSDPEDKNKRHVPRSTLIIFWIFIMYFCGSIVAAAYYLSITDSKIFNINQILSLSSNLSPSSIDLPFCYSPTSKTALRSSILENEYSGKVHSFQTDISSQSAQFHATITLQRGNNLYTYFINKSEIKRLVFFDPHSGEIKYRSIDGLQVGDTAIIREVLNLRRPPNDSKTKIEVDVL